MGIEGRELSHNTAELSEEMADMLFPKRRLCFCIPRYRSPPSSTAGPSWWDRIRDDDGAWWARGVVALKKLREWSEIVAGPRWKTFIRRLGRSRSGGAKASAKFQYDPLSYSLNFDDGGQNSNLDEEIGFRNFSCRYATLPMAVAKAETTALT